MDDQIVLDELASSDWYRVTGMLSRLSAEKEVFPSNQVLQRMIDLISDRDADIRRLAIFAVGLHWQFLPALSRIIAVLNDAEENADVLACSATAVGTIARNEASVREEVVRELAKAVMNERMPQEVRDTAYTSALWAAHRINPAERTEGSIPQDKNDVNWVWLTRLSHDPKPM